MTDQRFQDFLNKNRQPGDTGIVDVRGGIAKMREAKANRGVIPYATNVLGRVAHGLTQVVETPYNIVNRAPQLVNLLPWDQGVGTLSEEGAKVGGSVGNFFASLGKDPLIDLVAKNYPHMDEMGGINTPNPEYPITNRVAEDVGVGVGTMGAGALMSGAKGLAGVLGKFVGTPMMKAPVAATAGEVASSLGAAGGRYIADEYNVQNPVGRFALEMAGAMTPTGAIDFAETGAKRLFSHEGGQATVDAMDRLGMRPSIGLTGNENASTLENAAAILPFFGRVSKKVQTGQIDDFGKKLVGTANNIRPIGAVSRADDMMLGEQVYDIAKDGLNRMKTGFSQREEALMQTIGKDTMIDTTNLRAAMNDQMQYATGATKSALEKELKSLDDIADNVGRVPAQSLRNWRSQFGASIEDKGLLKGAKSQVYKGVTDDLTGAAKNAGVGDEFTKLMSEQGRAYNSDLRLSEGGDIPAMENLATNQLERGREFFNKSIANPDRVELLKRNATPEQWQQFAGDTLEYLGLAKDSAQGAAGDLISPNTFLTNWNKLDPRVKNIMFDDNLGTRQTLDDLAVVAEAMRKRGNSSNFSNTAGVGMSAGALGAIGGAAGVAGVNSTLAALPGAAVGAGITYGTVKALMSQTMARWAAAQGIPLGEKMAARAITGAAKAAQNTEEPKQRKFTPRPVPVKQNQK